MYVERLVVWLAKGPVLSRLQIECNIEKVSLGEVGISRYFQAMMVKKLDDLFFSGVPVRGTRRPR